jgi:hypothetical protein
MPSSATAFFNSIVGVITVTVITLLLFIFTNPVLGILYIVMYYMQTQRGTHKMERVLQTQKNTDYELKQMNTPANTGSTLEEHFIEQFAPIVPRKNTPAYVYSQFKPVNEPIGTASLI